ncbi:unnamed protein product [Gordionus sp. m RMFG-2023]
MAMTSVNLSDHKIVKAKILIWNIWSTSIGLNNNSKQPANLFRKQNINNLQVPEIKELFDRGLCENATNFESISRSKTMKECWMIFKNDIHVGRNNPLAGNDWISMATMDKIEELRLNGHLDRVLWKSIQRSQRSDRRIFTEESLRNRCRYERK